MLNFVIDDDEAQAVINRLLDAVPPGSYMAIAHASNESIACWAQRRLGRV
ncbi:SAM-dependent methyltransferase [Actinoplanes sp. NPDC051513]